MFRVATWNVNSVRKRLPHLLGWLSGLPVDVLLLQETRVEDALFPHDEFLNVGYSSVTNGQKARNGVAILSKHPFSSSVRKALPNISNDEARYIEVDIKVQNKNISVASVYVPNGQEVDSEAFKQKLLFLDMLRNHMVSKKGFESIFVVGGDFNVAPENIDVYSSDALNGSICFHPEERKRFRSMLNDGFVDLFRAFNPNLQEFSWWDYRGFGFQKNRGMRLDHIIASPRFADAMKETLILKTFRGDETPSDHAPVQSNINTKLLLDL